MAARMKTPADTADAVEDLSVVGRMVITCHDTGAGTLVPTVEFSPVGKINQGWFDRHQTHFLRAIQRAQAAQRRGDG